MPSSSLSIKEGYIKTEELENLVKYYKDGKMAHAYLISTNNIEKSLRVLLDVIKNIFCDDYKEKCNKCSLCHLVDIHNLPSLKIIEPDGAFIKKEQILELRNDFFQKPQYTKENIYIIKSAEKLNKESGNTILKFLEEPPSNVIGFFITTCENKILPTIESRCQVVEVNFANSDGKTSNISEDVYEMYRKTASEYLKMIDKKNDLAIIKNSQILENKEKEEIQIILQIILDIYQGELKNRENNTEYSYLNNYSKANLIKKIELIVEILAEINYNVNMNLLMDRFVLEMEAINSENI